MPHITQRDHMTKVGIVGAGFVGNAIHQAYKDLYIEVVVVDVDPTKSTGTYADLQDCDAVFVCVPSPSKDTGECDTSILNSVLYMLRDYKNVIISKTTAPPQFYEKMQTVYPNLVHIPEFLKANNAFKDYINETNAIIGGQIAAYRNEAARIIKLAQPITHVEQCSIGEAAFVKYTINTYLATKVVFMNEMCELATAHGYNWTDIQMYLAEDNRIGLSHMQVPGPDGSYGFGGMCFPKDTNAWVKYANKLGVQLSVLKTAIKKNVLLRLQKPK
jgi:nucleotide sugar dehydrogenase